MMIDDLYYQWIYPKSILKLRICNATRGSEREKKIYTWYAYIILILSTAAGKWIAWN